MREPMTVSEETQNFVESLIKLDESWTVFHNAIEFSYGKDQVDRIIDDEYSEPFKKLRRVIEDFLMDSIDCKISSTDKKITTI